MLGPMRLGRIFVVAALLAAGFAACDLNPQPLPPEDLGAMAPSEDGGAFSNTGDKNDADGSVPAPGEGDAGSEGGVLDSGDAGDAGDASDASDADDGSTGP